ncbi:MAG: DUF202 domain-containing protein [Corynebacterium sp.]|nr:DUF202 domain-containing protein [Corynebacterium sp.]
MRVADLPARGHADPALQPERNYLNWQRSVLNAGVVSVGLVKFVGSYGLWVFAVAAILLTSYGLVLATQFRRYRRGVRAMATGSFAGNPLAVVGLTATIAFFGLAEIVLILLTAFR